jgi:hypothetical protein
MSLHVSASRPLQVDDLESLQTKVRLRGGKLIAYEEVMSGLFVSVRAYRVRWVAENGDRRASAIPSFLVTLLLGPWSIQGPLWSLSAHAWNWRGGFEVTEPVMKASVGSNIFVPHHVSVGLSRQAAECRKVAWTLLAVLLLLVVGWIAWNVRR